jgi:hypothetical protein
VAPVISGMRVVKWLSNGLGRSINSYHRYPKCVDRLLNGIGFTQSKTLTSNGNIRYSEFNIFKITNRF